MKKILILCLLGDPTQPAGSVAGTGGFNASVNDIMNYLIETNQYSCTLITTTKGHNISSKRITDKITVYRLPLNTRELETSQDKAPFDNMLHSLEKLIDDFSEISFIHSFYWLSGQAAFELSVKYQIPFIHTTVSLAREKLRYHTKPASSWQLKFENTFLPNASYVLAITEEERRLLINEYHLSESRVIVEGQSVAETFHKPLYDSYGMPTTLGVAESKLQLEKLKSADTTDDLWWNEKAFIYVGRITIQKGVNIIIQAWLRLADQYQDQIPALWIVGNTPYEIQKFRESLNMDRAKLNNYEKKNRIVWWGYLSADAISTLYLRASVLVTHSQFEGGGRMILEALCQGLPVISTNTGFGKDYIFDWRNGFIVPYGETETLMLRMSHFIQNPFLTNVLGKNASEIFKQMEKHWHHKIRIMQLYKCFSEQKVYTDRTESFVVPAEDFFEKGAIDTYPYYYLRKTKEEIAEYLSACMQHNIKSEYIRQISNKDIWQYQETVTVKYLYSKLNKRTLWNVAETNSVISELEIMEKLDVCCKHKSILQPLKKDWENSMLVMPTIPILTESEIMSDYKEIAQCLVNFETLECTEKGLTISECWKNIKDSIRMLEQHTMHKFYENLPSELESHMKTSENTDDFCFQYAQPIIGHAGIWKYQIKLLPSWHWIIAEAGLDAGVFLTELLQYQPQRNPHDGKILLYSLSEIFAIPVLRILLWAICKATDGFLKNTVYGKSHSVDLQVLSVLVNLFRMEI